MVSAVKYAGRRKRRIVICSARCWELGPAGCGAACKISARAMLGVPDIVVGPCAVWAPSALWMRHNGRCRGRLPALNGVREAAGRWMCEKPLRLGMAVFV